MVAFKTEILIGFSLIITIIVVAFAALSILAGNIQTLFAGNWVLMDVTIATVYGATPIWESIVVAYVLQLSLYSLGPPLSWGAAILSLYNPNWWFNSWAQWYSFLSVLKFLGISP